jgi:hypothetical protein
MAVYFFTYSLFMVRSMFGTMLVALAVVRFFGFMKMKTFISTQARASL